MLIFLAAYLSNVVFSLYYNIKICYQPFDKEKLITSALKIADLRIKKGPGTGYAATGYIKPGV